MFGTQRHGETILAEKQADGLEVLETREWLDSLDYVLSKGGADRAGRLLQQLSLHARRAAGVNLPFTATTPYQNTISVRQQPPFPGSQEMERRIKSLVRWNALAMVVRANKIQEGIGGHISTFDAAGSDPGHLSRTFHPLSRESRIEEIHWRKSLGVSGRRRDG